MGEEQHRQQPEGCCGCSKSELTRTHAGPCLPWQLQPRQGPVVCGTSSSDLGPLPSAGRPAHLADTRLHTPSCPRPVCPTCSVSVLSCNLLALLGSRRPSTVRPSGAAGVGRPVLARAWLKRPEDRRHFVRHCLCVLLAEKQHDSIARLAVHVCPSHAAASPAGAGAGTVGGPDDPTPSQRPRPHRPTDSQHLVAPPPRALAVAACCCLPKASGTMAGLWDTCAVFQRACRARETGANAAPHSC